MRGVAALLAAAALAGVLAYGLSGSQNAPNATQAATSGSQQPTTGCLPQAGDFCECSARAAETLLEEGWVERALRVLPSGERCAGAPLLGIRAEALARAGRTGEAAAAAERALQQVPESRSARRAQALVALSASEFGRALERLQELLREDERDVAARFYLGLSQERANRYGPARQAYLKTLSLAPKHVEARYRLVVLTHSVGAVDEARHHLERLKAVSPIGDPRIDAALKLVGTAREPDRSEATPEPSGGVHSPPKH